MFKYFLIAALGTTFVSLAAAQDAKAVLDSAVKAMGGDNLGSIRYTATGLNYAFGQSYSPGTAYPKFNIKSYEKTVDFDALRLKNLRAFEGWR